MLFWVKLLTLNTIIILKVSFIINSCVYCYDYSAALGQCAEDKMSLKVIHDLDGVRLLWSLLKNPSARVGEAKASGPSRERLRIK